MIVVTESVNARFSLSVNILLYIKTEFQMVSLFHKNYFGGMEWIGLIDINSKGSTK